MIDYIDHYNRHRPHRGFSNGDRHHRLPPTEARTSPTADVVRLPACDDLVNEYQLHRMNPATGPSGTHKVAPEGPEVLGEGTSEQRDDDLAEEDLADHGDREDHGVGQQGVVARTAVLSERQRRRLARHTGDEPCQRRGRICVLGQ